jgi:hypothetical protein
MNEQMNSSMQPSQPSASGVSDWVSVWMDAVTKPSEQTFSRIARSPNAKTTTALLWIFLGSLLSSFVGYLVQGALMSQMLRNSDLGLEGFPTGAGGGFVAAICGAPIGAVISVVFFVVIVGIVQLVAKMFGGTATFDQMAYAMAAVLTPFYLVSSLVTLLTAIPLVGACFGIVSLLLALYALVLQVMAIKGANQFGWGQAIGSCSVPFLLILCCSLVAAIGIYQMLGPDFLNSIMTPVP